MQSDSRAPSSHNDEKEKENEMESSPRGILSKLLISNQVNQLLQNYSLRVNWNIPNLFIMFHAWNYSFCWERLPSHLEFLHSPYFISSVSVPPNPIAKKVDLKIRIRLLKIILGVCKVPLNTTSSTVNNAKDYILCFIVKTCFANSVSSIFFMCMYVCVSVSCSCFLKWITAVSPSYKISQLFSSHRSSVFCYLI